MVDTAKLEAEAKAVAAEVESAASGLLGVLWPRWERFKTKWQSDTLRKKVITAVLIVAAGGFIWYFGLSVGRLTLGSYRSAYAYGHGENVTRADITASIKDMSSKADISDLQKQIDAIKSDIVSMDDRFDKAEASKITTGSITKKRKPAPVKSSASSWFDLP